MATSDGIADVQQYEKWNDLFQKNCLKVGGRKKMNPSWGFFNEFEGNDKYKQKSTSQRRVTHQTK